jgi:uncharacterized protein with PIN domain
MNLAWFRIYEELNEFLPSEKRKKLFAYTFNGSPSVKDAIEANGIPHAEVDLILVNSISVGFSYKLRDGDIVSVYPVFETFDITSLVHLRPKPLRISKFILDVHLGKLAKYLRLCGFDTLYRKDYNDIEIINISSSEKRIILTHDVGLLKNKEVTHGYWIRSQHLNEQLKEVFLRFDLKHQMLPFTRCLECNGLLTEVSKEDIMDRLLPETDKYFTDFRKCMECDRIYWEGSHYERMKRYIDNLINNGI